MDQDLEQQIAQRMSELPEDVRSAILSSNLEGQLQQIGTKHGLHIDQVGALSDEVMLVMLGFSALDDFAGAIAAQVGVAPDIAEQIATEVNEQVFLPIRDSMKHFIETRAAAPGEQKPAPAAPASTPVAPPPAPKPTPELPMAEKLLSGKTVVPPPAPEAAPKPIYKADPYREPIE